MKPWRQMTDKEIAELKNKQCRKCRYFLVGNAAGTCSSCGYITMVGHSRGCDPRECDKFEPKKTGEKKVKWKWEV